MTAVGRFLRSRRERLSPAAAGVGASGRRRTPGLRREELALLAGISVDYLTRIEQGRERTPSPGVVAALADALQLDRDERQHLIALTSLQTQPELCSTEPEFGPVGPVTEKLLNHLEPMPAVVLEQWLDAIAWNQAYERLMAPAGLFGGDEPMNLLRFLFAEPGARALYRDWLSVARDQVRGLRAGLGDCQAQPRIQRLVEEVSADSPDLAELWAAQEVGVRVEGVHRLAHPVVGEMRLEYELLTLAGPERRTLLAYQAADQASQLAIQRLGVGRREHLRLVDEPAG